MKGDKQKEKLETMKAILMNGNICEVILLEDYWYQYHDTEHDCFEIRRKAKRISNAPYDFIIEEYGYITFYLKEFYFIPEYFTKVRTYETAINIYNNTVKHHRSN